MEIASQKFIEHLSSGALRSLKDCIAKELRLRSRRDKIQHTTTKDQIDVHSSNKDIELHNSKYHLSIRNINSSIGQRHRYYRALFDQDWSNIYPPSNGRGNFYVYAHSDPSSSVFEVKEDIGGNFGGRPFYIGKGSGDRAYSLKRNQGHGKMLRAVQGQGWKPEDIVHIVFDGLSEQTAFELESKLIYFFGTIYQKDRKKGSLYNLEIPKTPDFIGEMTKFKNRFGS